MLGPNQVDNCFIARDKCGVHRICRKEISIAGAQGVGLVADTKLQFTTRNPVRLIFGVRVRPVFSAGRVTRLKYGVAFIEQAGLQAFGFGS